jgi:hypothetical protein
MAKRLLLAILPSAVLVTALFYAPRVLGRLDTPVSVIGWLLAFALAVVGLHIALWTPEARQRHPAVFRGFLSFLVAGIAISVLHRACRPLAGALYRLFH